jgi:hypothetical protein
MQQYQKIFFAIIAISTISYFTIPKLQEISKKSNELEEALNIQQTLEKIHYEWSIKEGNFDWNRDNIIDNIDQELSSYGYPINLGKLPINSFQVTKALVNDTNILYTLYTSTASHPINGVDYRANDIAGEPDKNDFWIYVIEANSAFNECTLTSSKSRKKIIKNGDFLLIDINGTQPIDFTHKDLGINFLIDCPS